MFCIEKGFENIRVLVADGVGGNTENVGVVVAARFDGFGGIVADSSADAFVTVSLDAHTLAGTANEDAKRVIAWVAENGFGDLASIVVVIIFSVIFVCAKIREWNLEAREPIDDLTFELIAAMVGAKIYVIFYSLSHFAKVDAKFDEAVTIAPLIVIPGNNLDEVVVDDVS